MSRQEAIPAAVLGSPVDAASLSSRESNSARVLLTMAFTAILLLGSVYYARIQNVWIDESTQLSGATLGLRELLSWLAGSEPARFGVPADRMPPISYLIDSACARTLCGTTFDFRLLHLLITAAGVAALLSLIARRHGPAACFAAGIFLALSPRLVETSVEIRAYPILFTITCFQLRSFYRIVERPQLRDEDLLVFFGLGLASIYTHFFGLVATMAMVLGLIACRARIRFEFLRIIALGTALVLASAGLAPFVTGAASISGAEQAAGGLGAAAALVPRVIGHPANMVSLIAATLLFGSLVILVALTFWRVGVGLAQQPGEWSRSPLMGLIIALLSGLAVTLLASFAAKGFNPLKPSYSGWILPFVAILAAAGTGALRGRARVLILPLFIGAAAGHYIFLTDAHFFVHGPERSIRQAIGAEAKESAVVYVGPNWGYGFFPIWFDYQGRVPQWVLGADGLHRINKGGAIGQEQVSPKVLGTSNKLIVVDIQTRSFHALRQMGLGQSGDLTPAVASLENSIPAIRQVQAYTVSGLYSADIAILRKM